MNEEKYFLTGAAANWSKQRPEIRRLKALIFSVILFFLIKGGTNILFDIFFGGKK